MRVTEIQPNDPWYLAEDIHNIDFFFSHIWLRSFVEQFEQHTGRAYSKVLSVYVKDKLSFYFGKEDSFDVAEHILERMMNDPEYTASINPQIREAGKTLKAFGETIPTKDLHVLSPTELVDIFETHHIVHTSCYTWFWIGNAIDMFHGNFTKKIRTYLLDQGIPQEDISTVFITLTEPTTTSPVFEEQQSLLRVAAMIEQDAGLVEMITNSSPDDILFYLPQDIIDALRAHWNMYHYTKCIFISGEYTLQEYIEQIKDLFVSGLAPSKVIREQHEHIETQREKRTEMMDRLHPDTHWKALLDAFSDFMVTKMERRYAQLFVLHRMDAIIREVAKRHHLTPAQVRYMFPDERRKLMLSGDVDEQLLSERVRRSVYYAERGHEELCIGEKAEECIHTIPTIQTEGITQLEGETACLGIATGPVKIIIRPSDMYKMNEGDILVSIATDPDIVPAMKKAAAIVTEQGGVTSHAAIVSRELGIPCLIGTKIATKVFQDGDIVEVDTAKGIIRKV